MKGMQGRLHEGHKGNRDMLKSTKNYIDHVLVLRNNHCKNSIIDSRVENSIFARPGTKKVVIEMNFGVSGES